jgi:hypothetical protein
VIKTDRVPQYDPEDLSALVKVMRKGTYRPILLLEDMTLVDGLGRIEAAKLAGLDQIEAIVTNDYVEIREELKDAHKYGPPSLWRISEFHPILLRILKFTEDRLKRAGQWKYGDRPEGVGILRLSKFGHKALNLPYEGYMYRVVRLITTAKEGDPKAIELLKQVEDGVITPGRAFNIQEQYKYGQSAERLSPADQIAVMEASIRNIAMTARALRKLIGPHIKVPREDFRRLVAELKIQRSELYTLISTLAKEAGKQG